MTEASVSKFSFGAGFSLEHEIEAALVLEDGEVVQEVP
jgi:hypothetical protein